MEREMIEPVPEGYKVDGPVVDAQAETNEPEAG
jgi:hypothetical protein